MSISSAIKTFVRGQDTDRVPSRDASISRLRSGRQFDVLVVGGGSTGAGAALDAATRGLSTACVERYDFGSGTSSRSTKLIWGGSRYLANALCSLFHQDLRLLRHPIDTVRNFSDVFRMVMSCHRERSFMLREQPHLVSWIPIAVPFTKWFIWPPPFGNPMGAIGPIGVFPVFFKFYDALCGFTCPPSHVMTPSRTARKFPQMTIDNLKYCSVFYEGQFDDARTNLALALTAAREGAVMANYCNVVRLIRQPASPRVLGAVIRDELSGEEFEVLAKSVVFCAGAYTDALRRLEYGDNAAAPIQPAVMGASGTHIVIPAYFSPSNFGMVDMNTSDGRFLFILPWQGHVLVGTTDSKCDPQDHPQPPEADIKWLVNEARKYLNPEISLERKHVMSAWMGIRPLAVDPHASTAPGGDTASASRDHVISHNPETGIIFAAGGKWTTYREIASDVIDKAVEVARLAPSSKCRTLEMDLVGRHGYTSNLAVRLIQEFDIKQSIANRLTSAFGGRAYDVVKIGEELYAKKKGLVAAKSASSAVDQTLVVPDYPYTEAEVVYAIRHEWACKPEDIVCRRTRLAFLNKEAALVAVPRVAEIMGRELGWSADRVRREAEECAAYVDRSFAGAAPKDEPR